MIIENNQLTTHRKSNTNSNESSLENDTNPRTKVVGNLISDERDFVQALDRFSTEYVVPLMHRPWFTAEDHKAMFGSIGSLLEFHRNILLRLESGEEISQVFNAMCDNFESVYSMHIAQISPALEIASKYSNEKQMLDFLQA